MEALGILAVLVVLAIPAAVVFLLIRVSRLSKRVEGLERRVTEVARASFAATPPPVAATAVSTPPAAAETATQEYRMVAPKPPVPDLTAVQELAPQPEPEGTSAQPGPWEIRPSAGDVPNAPIVMRAERVSALGSWLKVNWAYAISALSLALAGVFFVQYGIEKGLLPPVARVAMAIAFGMALIVAGEWIRRRYGDDSEAATAYLPATFSGAGLVSMFAGVVAARQLYGLIGVETAFAGLVAVSVLAVVLGWFNGPFLAAVGLLGAAAAPFAVGGQSESVTWLYGYFAVIALAGLAVDAVRRWAWISVLALAVSYGGGWMIWFGGGEVGWFAPMLTMLALLAIAVPLLRLQPDHDGPTSLAAVLGRSGGAWPEFPTRLAGGAMLASVGGLWIVQTVSPAESLIVFLCLALLALAVTAWADRAPALADLAILPALGFVARLVTEATNHLPLHRAFEAEAIALRAPETGAPVTATGLLGLAVLVTAVAVWRSLSRPDHPRYWALGAVAFAPAAAVVLEVLWRPSQMIGAYPWALHVSALAALMVAAAGLYARADGEDRRRVAYATLAALTLIAFSLTIVLTKGALTLAFAVLVVVAAALDRRLKMPEMGLFVQGALVVLSWRLVVDPGLSWAVDDAALWEVLAVYGGVIAAAGAAILLLRGMERQGAQVFLESALAAYSALGANVLISRWLIETGVGGHDRLASHWAISLNAMPWLVLALVQLYRLRLGGRLNWLRWTLAAGAGLLALAGFALAVLPFSPLVGLAGGYKVSGPLVLDTLLVAYLLPAILIFAALPRLGHLRLGLRRALAGFGAFLAALFVALEIRRFWQGDDLSVPGVVQGELYSYTLAMMAVGAGLLYQALARRSDNLRRVAMAVIALTIAKVFLIDASGLSGLTRVFSFLALGLSLAGLAWLNRWALRRGGSAGN